MKIIIQTPGVKAQKKLQDFVTLNVSKLSGLSDRIVQADVLLKVDKSDTKVNKICEIKLVIPGNDLFASKKSGSFEEASLKCVEAMRHQLLRKKDLADRGKRRGSVTTIEADESI